ncbi:hypothetical protein JCM11251_004868 [Rhodosporidiobolus azoricus]
MYLERQQALRTVCLVNRQLRHVAQPVLQEVVRCCRGYNPKGRQAFVGRDIVRCISRALVLITDVENVYFFAGWVALREVRLYGIAELDLTFLEGLPALEVLVLRENSLYNVPVRLMNVVSLSFLDCDTTTEERATFVKPHLFPRLRHLVYWMERDEDGKEPFLQLTPSLIDQLDTVILLNHLSGISRASVRPAALFDGMFECAVHFLRSALAIGARFFRLWLPFGLPFATHHSDKLCTTVYSIAAQLTMTMAPAISLELIYLPTIFRPSEHLPASLSSATGSLLALCASRHIQVDFEDVHASSAASFTSPKFAAYTQGLRQKKVGTA